MRSAPRDGVEVIAYSGDLDLVGAPELGPMVADAARRGGPRLVIDLTAVGHVDSTGLAVLLNAKRRMTRQHGRLIIASQAPSLLRLIGLTRLSGDLDVRPTMDEAIRAACASGTAPGSPRGG